MKKKSFFGFGFPTFKFPASTKFVLTILKVLSVSGVVSIDGRS